MVTELLVIWIVGVVSFFVLWAILLKVIKRISEKKEKRKAETEDPNL
jgi:flagellar biosynthesis/type III secretory pathway M-ring protein FliF/YscJ